MRRLLRSMPASLATMAILFLVGTGSAEAAVPWWGVTSEARPTHLSPGTTDGTVAAAVTNLGTAPTTGPVVLTDTLPEGVTPLAVSFHSGMMGLFGDDLGPQGEFEKAPFNLHLHLCSIIGRQVTCTYKTQAELEAGGVPTESAAELGAPLTPYRGRLELIVRVAVGEGLAPSLRNEVSVSGGGASGRSITAPLTVSEEPTPFGMQAFQLRPEEEGGRADVRAGSHPFQLTTLVSFDQTGASEPVALPKDVSVALPPGLAGKVAGRPECELSQFAFEDCPLKSIVGVATVLVHLPQQADLERYRFPIFVLSPAYGEPARFAFGNGSLPIVLDTSLRDGPTGDYGITVGSFNTSQISGLLASEITFWGTPGDARHDSARGLGCLGGGSCLPFGEESPVPLLTLPGSCPAHPFSLSLEARSWLEPAAGPHPGATYTLENAADEPLSLSGCEKVPFSPTTHAEPTSNAATSPTGLSFDLAAENPGLSNPEGIAESQIKKAVVTLPEGFTANPSVAAGLGACPQSAYEATTLEAGTGCPEDSKIGEVEAESPLVEGKVVGSLFVARQHENPFGNLLTVYMVFKNPELGVMVKAAGKVEPNPVTGQLTTTFDELPQLPISHFHLFFRQGQRAPLITPPACGTYAVKSLLYPWSNPEVPREEDDAFQITVGPEGGGCPSGGVPPFHPGLEAGTINNRAGSYSPFYLRLSRKDSEQEITHFSIKLPPGLLGKLAGVSYCPDAGIAQAKSREHEGGGAEEEASPSCPSSSQVGRTEAGTGVGTTLAWVPGKVYLAGPYHGAPLSIVAITAAKVGPFDLGTVVVREALRVNPETAEVFIDATGSDPLPHIVDGIPVHLRDIRVYVDRPEFTLNPTDCEPTSTASTVLGSGANFASEADDDPVTVSSRFQAADCAALAFKPALAIKLVGGKTHRGGLPALKSVLTYPKGVPYANIAKAQITLPPSEILEQGHLHDVCTKTVWTQGTVPGEKCPANSVYGHARAYTPLLSAPLEGNVYLRTGYGTKLPELVAALNGQQINVDVVGTIDSVHKKGSEIASLRTTFASVPDAPVSKFELELEGGRKGLLTNTTDICQGTHKAIAAFTGQNGKLDEFQPTVTASCKGQKKKGRKAGHGHGKKGHGKKGH